MTTGGLFLVGDYDLIRPVSMALGAKEIFWQPAQKPGKPRCTLLNIKRLSSSDLIGLPGTLLLCSPVLLYMYRHY